MTDKLIQIFADELMLDPTDLNDDTNPDNTEEWDSLAAMRLVAAIEGAFDVRLSTAEIMKMRSIGIVRTVLAEKGVTL
ncbi:MAG: acyl carrier protein [Caulobacterales bacterium]|nr:acyl carrier protein [Caulobacterales bacterium]